MKFKKEKILFVAFAGWDTSGAKWFRYPTFWLNLLNNPGKEPDAIPEGIGNNMTDLLKFIDHQL